MSLISAIDDPAVARRILCHLGLPARAPPRGRPQRGQRQLALDPEGVLAPGATVLVTPPPAGPKSRGERFPLRTKLEGPPPWALRWARGAIEVKALDEERKPIPEFTVAIDGEVRASRGGTFAMDGIPAGRHEVIVSATGRRSRTWSFDLADGATKVVEGRLGPIPKAK